MTLAIKGHATRGKEIIEILEMLGGDNTIKYDGSYTRCYYFLDDTLICSTYGRPHLQCYTLEEFLEKYPYKVGDKVTIKERDKVVTITDMSWRNGREIIYETIHNGDCYECFSADELQPYKEPETMDKANKAVFDVNAQCCDIMNHLIKEETMEELKINISPMQMGGAQAIIPIPKGYEFAGVDDDNKQVVFDKIKPKYPKTYAECCDVLFPHSIALGKVLTSGYNCELLKKLGELLICCDAYWKIAGEQMGLGKPWSPSKNDNVYCIFRLKGEIVKDNFVFADSLILEFPTEEMRDAFYENFKGLIEQCKELL